MAATAAAFSPAPFAGRPAASSHARHLGALPCRRTVHGPARLSMRSAPPGVDFAAWDTPENPPAYFATVRAPRYSSMVIASLTHLESVFFLCGCCRSNRSPTGFPPFFLCEASRSERTISNVATRGRETPGTDCASRAGLSHRPPMLPACSHL